VREVQGFDQGEHFDHAWQAVESARRAADLAQRAERAAAKAAEAADRQDTLASRGGRAANMHARLAAAHRRSEACQRAAARMHAGHAERLRRWVARQDADTLLRPVFMSAVAASAGWRAAVLTVATRRGVETLVAASDDTSRRAHELEVNLGEGPSRDTTRGSIPVVDGAALTRRWPNYGPAVERLGVCAVSGVPLSLGSRGLTGSLTVLDMFSPRTNTHDGAGLYDVAEALTRTVLCAPDLVEGEGPGGLALFEEDDFQPVLHQAAGVLHERCGWDIDDAVALIRAHAYAEERPVAAVAGEVVQGSLLLP
jgi:hypothetical protein